MLLRMVAAIAGVVLLGLPAAARAEDPYAFNSMYGCIAHVCDVDPADGPNFFNDYTVPSDGRHYRWDFIFDDPNATLFLAPPNQVESFFLRAAGDGTFDFIFNPNVDFQFERVIDLPGRVSYLVAAPRSFDTCGPATHAGVICRAQYDVFGNSTFLTMNADAPFHLTFREVAVPEPGTWALMILGFGGIGAALRARRRGVAVVG